MTLYFVTIVCAAHVLSCNLPHPVYDRLHAESKELCEASVRYQAEAEGMHGFIVTCSDRGA